MHLANTGDEVCIPKYELVKDASFTKTDFDSSRQILLGKGYKDAKEVAILFEETFYNNKDESYRVLCVSEVFNRAVETGSGDKIHCLTTEAIG
ncbi:hypothetical protein DPMN_027698 [Dreissena polymorpha]|uniref:Uncharacterized protein n=1 Tax=Dreissena polymorpha TaxID=45954 RepID=A0A9D4RDV8_DREPO|nr:hypothetical protein DPMN_027698 [Dreissena polymorpha]